METFHWTTHAVFLSDLLIRIGLSLRVIGRRLPVGVSLAWLAVILSVPFAGAFLYLLVGEYRLGRRRTRRAAELESLARKHRPRLYEGAPAEWGGMGTGSAALARVAQSSLGCAVLAGNSLKLLENAAAAFPALIADIEAARRTCDLEFYIWSVGGTADEVVAAVIRAVGRGVSCRGVRVVLIVPARIDSRLVRYASRAHQAELLAAGVEIHQYNDGLLHTKSIMVDGQFSLFGSLNLDPRSLRLDFEITLAVYDADFTQALRRLQQTYLDQSTRLERLAEDSTRLVGPLL